jgi:triosephosphate isomerase (TIM)
MTLPRRKLVAGNWKMHGSLAANRELVEGLRAALGDFSGADVAVCVPSPYLAQVAELVAGSAITLGAQNASEHTSGAFTGEQSVTMLKELGCTSVIIGHSERRALFGETNAQVAAKLVAVLAAGLTPIFCMGETLAEREADATEAVIAAQLDAVIAAAGIEALTKTVLAYEPVWAIGTGKTASPEQAQAVHAFIRGRVSNYRAKQNASVAAGVKILYGGSVKSANARALFGCADIDGGLVGGASLQAAEFAAICRAAVS